MIELSSCAIFYLRKSAQSVDKISDENPQISQIGADLLNLIFSSMVIILSVVMQRIHPQKNKTERFIPEKYISQFMRSW